MLPILIVALVLVSAVALYFALRHLLAEAVARESARLAAQLDAGRQTVGERMAETGRAVADVREQLGRLAETSRRLEALGEGVADVRRLLQVPRLRGTVGELWLAELLRQTFPPSHYTLQHTFRSGERVDAVVRIGGRLLPIDAKFPLDACQRMLALDAAGDVNGAERERRLFRRSMRNRVDEIAAKYVRPEEGTLDFALMYVPAESVYYEAVVRDAAAPGAGGASSGDAIMAYAMDRRVIPVSPHTFYAYLSAVLHGLKGLRVEERAREILAELGGLEQRFERFWTAFEKVGTHLRNASAQYDESRQAGDRIRQQLARITESDDAPSVPASAATLPVGDGDGVVAADRRG
ncbi:MAG TPA: DNA recombination protein RmuC [Gemmatimonadaceae bacterium]|nr:DNA recombination protein RmuC [Gemmatimonadaceae bacterium]